MKIDAIIGIIPIEGVIYYNVNDAAEALEYQSISEAVKLLPVEDTYILSIHGSVDAKMLTLTNLHGLELLIRHTKNSFLFKNKDMIIKKITPETPKVPFIDGVVKVIPCALNMQIEFSDQSISGIDEEAKREVYTVTEIAVEYGWTPRQLNSFLKSKKVQWKTNNRWQINRKYAKKGLVTYKYRYSHMQWTAKGKAFIAKLMQDNGYVK